MQRALSKETQGCLVWMWIFSLWPREVRTFPHTMRGGLRYPGERNSISRFTYVSTYTRGVLAR